MMTQTEIAKQAKVSQQFISSIFRGKNRPTWKRAKDFAKRFGTTPTVWLEGTKEEIMAAIETVTKQ
ncbi:MAG: helix-turn-helix transcriptional regulator [Desulfobacteraceae bacterium]|nr:helix-turn-helix transcriptional regulator [Desulfobacteraceae bacterium]